MRRRPWEPDMAVHFLIPLVAIASLPFSPGDLSAWTALGVRTLRLHQLQRVDVFSVLPTRELIYPSWGPSLLYGALYPWTGIAGLCALHWIIPVLILLWMYRASLFRFASTPPLGLRLAIYASWIGAIPAFAERPSALALIPLVLGFDEVSRIRGLIRPRRLLALVLLEVCWVNLHGSFVLLPLLLGWRVALLAPGWRGRPGFGRKLGAAIQALAAVLVSALVNPFGWKVYPYVLETASTSTRRGITEWARVTPFTSFPAGLMQYGLTLFSLWLLWKAYGRGQLRRRLASPFFALLLMGFLAVRGTALPFVVFPSFLTRNFRSVLGNRKGPMAARFRVSTSVLAASLALAWIALWPWFKPRAMSCLGSLVPESRARVFDGEMPLGVIERIRRSNRPGCAVFGEIELGGALMLGTPNRIFMDTRNIIYTDREYAQVTAALDAEPGWREYLASHGACFIAVNAARHLRLARRVEADSAWRFIAADGAIRLFERR